ncbi:MAG: TIGR03619 family F420-dependent LLM class oxidoreductase [Caulobacterales bacterium]|nr:TIGR03619 family F420-dependent LLM class oxidoreductase [Caulobacterales bacterium]
MPADLKIGVNVYKFSDFSRDFREVVHFVQTAERLGYSHVRFQDHVVGIAAEKHGGLANTPYTDRSVLRECFTIISYLTAVTSRIEFMTGVLVLPQRQTALVAKQAAEIDIMSGGRISLGVGIGYNAVEYEALGMGFKDRAARFEEQVHVLRRLWTENDVSFQGQFHTLTDVSLAPRPSRRIPLFFGMGRSANPIPPDVVLERCGRLADGWLPIFGPDEAGREAVGKVHDAAARAGRDPSDLVMEMGLSVDGLGVGEIQDELGRRRAFGAQRVNLQVSGTSAAEQTAQIERLAEALALC